MAVLIDGVMLVRRIETRALIKVLCRHVPCAALPKGEYEIKYIDIGVIAGFVATAVLSLLMLVWPATGLMPPLDTVPVPGEMARSGTITWWVVHFVIDAVLWGGLFALFDSWLPGDRFWLKGVIFAIGAWLLMIFCVRPLVGAGASGAASDIVASVVTLVLHASYGAVLGGVYGALRFSARVRRRVHP